MDQNLFVRTLRYHIGTLAFGALIIAIIRMIRLMIEYVEGKLKEYHQENPLVKVNIF
jgi:choline transporter-like protein 2/4/5